MDNKEVLASLNELCRGKEWFYDLGVDQFNRPVVYVRSMLSEVTSSIPDRINGVQVMVHYAPALLVKKDQFVTMETTSLSITDLTKPAPQMIDDEEDNTPIEVLVKELDRLERICGTNILCDVFFEEHDGENAVTNLSSKYPEVRESIHKLYETYGFDLIYEELEL